MNWLDRIIAPLAPSWALARARNRHMLAAYEVAEPSRLRRQRTDKRSANVQNQKSAETIRTLARHMEQNLDIASGALDVLVTNTVGSGIRPEPQVKLKGGEPAKDVNDELSRLFDDWRYRPEVTGQYDYYEAQRMVARSLYRDGEVLAQLVLGTVAKLDHGTIVPFSLELLEADFLPYDLNDVERKIVQGVELNEWRGPIAYHVYKGHPGESVVALETKRITAQYMLHLKHTKRLHQLRGVSVFAPVLARLDDIKEIDESERVAARVAAALAVVIKKGTPDTYDTKVAPANRTMEFAPGMVIDDLLPGESIEVINSNRPNSALIPFRNSQLKSGAAGFGISYSSLAKDYSGTYSSQRQELVESAQAYGILSANFASRFCDRTWWGFVDAAKLSGKIKFGGDVDLRTIYDVSHSLPPLPWIDPLKELLALELAEKRGYKSRSRIIRERGDNPDQVNQEIARDQAEKDRLGLKLGDPAPQPQPAQPPEPPEDEQ